MRPATSAAAWTAVAIGFAEAPKAWHVCEFKTHGHKSFAKLVAEGVERSKPLHWAQMQAYMQMAGIDRAFYLAVCKDTDELYQERIRHDADAGLRILAKAARIVGCGRAANTHQRRSGLVAVPVLRPPCRLP